MRWPYSRCWDGFLILVALLMVICMALVAGCSQQMTNEQVNNAYAKALALAEEGKVRGKIKLILNSDFQIGLIEAVTIRSPGSRLEAELELNYDNGTE